MSQLVKAIREGYVYSWQYSKLRKKHYGSSSREIPASQFVVFTQNHDHVGNRMLGERLNSLIPFPAMKLVAALVLHSPYIPILFMGEEFGETNPFLFFVSHSEPELIEAVRKGRSDEFKHFEWADQTPDPESEETFLRSKIDWNKLNYQEHRVMLEYYKQLLYLRRETPALRNLDKNNLHLFGKESENLFIIHSKARLRSPATGKVATG
jgi:maltooligosyltrehalose trehalohydrolase